MFKQDAVDFFGSKSNVAKAAGVERSAVSQWGELVPEGRAVRLQEASDGFLRYDKNIYDQYRNAKRSGGLNHENQTAG